MGDRHRLTLLMASCPPGAKRTRAMRALSASARHDEKKVRSALKEAYLRGWTSSDDAAAALTGAGQERLRRYGGQ